MTAAATAAPAAPASAIGERAIGLVERGRVPDALIRLGIRKLLRERLAEVADGDPARQAEIAEAFVATLASAPVAPLPEKANEQHYELPPAFFAAVLGRHARYSSGWWPAGVETLDAAEEAALAATCERAGLADGQTVLELGCGWGSLTLFMAARYPASRIVAVSNSHAQRGRIEALARERGLANVEVRTADVNRLDLGGARFDRVVSVEMFEHLRNWPEAFRRVASWLAPGGRFFQHVFAYRGASYPFEARDASDWMSRHFFSGGMMPGDDLALRCQEHLRVVRRWRWNGTHYARTSEAWLAKMDAAKAELRPLFVETYGAAEADRWWVRWRLFFLSVAELFAFDGGRCWYVLHTLFERREAA